MSTSTRSNHLQLLASALTLVAAGFAGSLQAGTVTTTMPVSATISASCSGFSATAMNFGDVSSGAGANATSTLSITCTTGGAYTIAFDGGSSGKGGCFGGPAYQWKMAAAGVFNGLGYQLFKDAARTNLVGVTPACPSQTATGISGTGNGAAQTVTVYGAVGSFTPASFGAGTYSDTITLTATF